MLEQAFDYRDECTALQALLAGVPAAEWTRPTRFKDWTFDDIIGHLHIFDHAAALTLDSTESLRAFFADMQSGRTERWTLRDYTRRWLDGCGGPALLERWYTFAQRLAQRYANEPPDRRVAWGGPDMSVRSCISARQMETWSHGQAIFDRLGVERVEHDRLRNIAIMGVNTFGWTFVNRGLAVPPVRPRVLLRAPSGASWEWNADCETDLVAGSAVDFCRVVTQTRNLADTALEVRGEVALRWMSMAQCFAGPPHEPPAPGSRFREARSA